MASDDDVRSESFHPHQSKRSAPILRLPTETLQHIFVQSVQSAPQLAFWGLIEPDLTIPFPEPDPAQTPLLLTQICRLWRAVSVSTPELWCSVRVSIPNNSHYKKKGELLRSMLETWLRNSQGRPFNIVLGKPGLRISFVTPPLGTLWHYILPVFTSHANHCSTLIASPDITEYLLERKVHMPTLKTLWSQNLLDYRLLDIGHLIPKLSSLSVATLDGGFFSPLTVGVAHGLRHLSLLTCDTAVNTLTILAHFPRLLSFQLRDCWDSNELLYPTATKTIVHQTLEQLLIPWTVIMPCARDMLSLPSLRIMVVTGMWEVTHMQSVATMLSRSSCSLQYLEFTGCDGYYDVDRQMGYEAEQLFAFSPHVRVCDVDFKRPPLSPGSS